MCRAIDKLSCRAIREHVTDFYRLATWVYLEHSPGNDRPMQPSHADRQRERERERHTHTDRQTEVQRDRDRSDVFVVKRAHVTSESVAERRRRVGWNVQRLQPTYSRQSQSLQQLNSSALTAQLAGIDPPRPIRITHRPSRDVHTDSSAEKIVRDSS